MATQQTVQTPKPTKGLLDAAMSATQQVAPQQTSGQVERTQAPAREQAGQWKVADDQTVQGNIRSIVDEGGPLQQQAQTRALQSANRRGLLNSSMAVTAGQSALYDAALPIAQQDASTRATAGQFNVAEQNKLQSQQVDQDFRAGLSNQQAFNEALARDQAADLEAQRSNQSTTSQIVGQQIELGSKERMLDLDRALQREMQSADAATKVQLQEIDATTRRDLANIEANYKTLMQTNASAQELYQQTLKNMTDIMMNKKLSAAGKQQALNNQYALLRDGMGILGAVSNMNLVDLLKPGNIPGAGSPIGSDAPAPSPAPNTTTPVARPGLSNESTQGIG